MTIKLLSGLFRSTLCSVFVTGKGILIRQDDSAESETLLAFGDIKDISVSQSGSMQARLEITAGVNNVSGIFDKQSDADEFVKQIRAKAGKALRTELRFQ